MRDPKRRTPGELLAAIHEMRLDDELERIAALSHAEVAAEIRAEGGDPEAIGRRGAAFMERELARLRARTVAEAEESKDAQTKKPG